MVSNIPDILKDAINEILSLVKLMSSVAVNDDFRRLYGGLITAMLKQVEISLPDSVSLHDFLCIAELRPVYHMLSINTDTLDISFRRGLKSLKTFLEWRYWDNKQPISPNDLAFFDRINSLYVSDMTDVRWDLLDHLYKQVLRSATRSMEARLAVGNHMVVQWILLTKSLGYDQSRPGRGVEPRGYRRTKKSV